MLPMIYLLFFLFLTSAESFAQDMFSFMSPQSPNTSIELEGMFSPTEQVDKGPESTQVLSSGIGINQKIIKMSKDTVSVSGKWQRLNFSENQRPMVDYENIQGTIGWKKIRDENRISFFSVGYGSASDRAFKNGRDGTANVNFIHQFNDKWFGVANYSNNRPFLNNIPLPGFLWVKEMTRTDALIVGFPIIYWLKPLSTDWSLKYFGLIPWNHRVKVMYNKYGFIKPYFMFDQSPMSFFRHDREEKFERVFWVERRVGVGVEGFLSRSLRFDISGGYAFDRQLFEARNFSQRKKFLYNVDNTYFVGMNLFVSF